MTDNLIYDLVHEVIQLVTGIQGKNIIPADDNEQSPSGSYASIKIGASRSQRGQANINLGDTGLITSPIGLVRDVDHSVKAQIVVDVSVNFYRGNAIQNALNIFQSNKLPAISALLFAADIGWHSSGAINDLTALQSKEREERSQVTIKLLYEQVQTVTTNAIYSVEVIAENENGDTLQTETINAPTGV